MLIGKQNSESFVGKPRSLAGILFLYACAVFLLPIDWVAGIRAFGEFSIMSSFYILLPVVALGLPFVMFDRNMGKMAPELWWFVGLMSASLLMSFIVNIPDILSATLKERSGLNKVVTTFITFYFSMALMILTAKLAQRPDFLRMVIFKPIRLSLLLVFFVCLIEIIGRYSGFFGNVYLALSEIFRSGYTEVDVNDGRLRGVSGEPASMAVFLGFALVCSYGIIGLSKVRKKGAAIGYVLFLTALFVFVLSGARTSYVMLLALFLSLVVFPILVRFKPPKIYKPLSFPLFLLFCMAFAALLFLSHSNTIAKIVSEGDSISNLSRYASNYTAFSLFLDSPLFGKGPGQYAFEAQKIMPYWGWQSWEIRDWFTNPLRTWPPTFSLPARLASEHGILGVLAWYIPLLELFRRLLFTIRKEYIRLGNRVPVIGATLFLGMVYVFFQGVAQESFRFFELWIMLGIVSAYVMREHPETFYSGQMPEESTSPFLEKRMGIKENEENGRQ